jgi:hypothetical protein
MQIYVSNVGCLVVQSVLSVVEYPRMYKGVMLQVYRVLVIVDSPRARGGQVGSS